MSTDNITISGLTFSVSVEPDDSHGAPWEECDGHGPVSDWTTRGKLPGERVLWSDRGCYRYYDVAEAMRIAKRDGWGISPDARAALVARLGREPTAGEIAAAAVESNFQYLRAWCNDEWSYVLVVVTLLDTDGDETWLCEAIGGVESHADDYIAELAQELARHIAEQVGDATHIEHGAKRVRVR